MTTKRNKILAMMAVLAVGATAAGAQEARGGRYTMHPSGDGFVRLDTETGAVSQCQRRDGSWSCETMSGPETSAREAETDDSSDVARLTRENNELRQEVRRLEELLGLRGDRNRQARGPNTFRLPTESEVDGALDYFEKMLKKFQDRLKRLEQNSPPPERQL